MAKAFTSVPVSRNIPHSRFNLSYTNKFASYFGQLIPAFVQEVLPGDSFKIGSQIAIRLQPLEAPMMSSIYFDMRYFFVPNRIVDDDWEDFINYSFNSSGTLPEVPAPLQHSLRLYGENGIFFSGNGISISPSTTSLGLGNYTQLFQFSLWNFFGLPIQMDKFGSGTSVSTTTGDYCSNMQILFNALDITPVAYPWRAYNSVYNYFYRDENIDDEVSLDSDRVQWSAMPKNDYFYSALPFAQKGPAPAISLNLNGAYGPVYLGTSHAMGAYANINDQFGNGYITYPSDGSAGGREFGFNGSGQGSAGSVLGTQTAKNKVNVSVTNASASSGDTYAQRGLWSEITNNASVSMSAEDFRNLFAVQEFMENLALCGSRYSEYIYSNFGVYTGDYRIGKPQYLGGFKNQVLISEIAQTSASVSTGTPQGNLAGRGVGAGQGVIKPCHFTEHGYIIGIFRILPDIEYFPRGIDKKFIKQSVMDYYLPTFAHLGEQPIKKYELYIPAVESTTPLTQLASRLDVNFGFQGIYSEYRHNKNIATGYMSYDYMHWNLARRIQPSNNDPANLALNSSFIKCIGTEYDWNRIFASGSNEPPFFVSVANLVKASRCIPTYAVPSRIVR